MSWLTDMLAAGGRLLTYYNGDEKSAGNPGGMTGPNGMAENWDPCIRDIGTAVNGVGMALTAITTSETNAAASATAAGGSATGAAGSAAAAHTDRLAADADAVATAADRLAVAADKSTVHTDRLAADAAAAATAADRLAVAADKSTVHTDRLAADADANATAADRLAVTADKSAVATDKAAAHADRLAADASAAAAAAAAAGVALPAITSADTGKTLIVKSDGSGYQTATPAGAVWAGTSGGAANAQTLTPVPALGGLTGHPCYEWLAGQTNTGATTLNVSGTGAISLRDAAGAALVGGEVVSGTKYVVTYDGTYWRLAGGGASLPSQAGNGGKFLLTNGTSASWGNISEAAILPTTTITGTSQAMAANNSYITNNASRVTLTLPTTSAVGDLLEVLWLGAGGWKVAQNSGQYVIWGSTTTTTGATDGLQSGGGGASARLKCVVANTAWEVISYSGAVAQIGATSQSWDPANKTASLSLTSGNTIATQTVSNTGGGVRGFACPLAGAYYFELVLTQDQCQQAIGFCTSSVGFTGMVLGTGSYVWYGGITVGSGNYYTNGTSAAAPNFAQGDIIGVAVDFSAGKIWFSKNGVWQSAGNPAAGTSPAILIPAVQLYPYWTYNTNTGQIEISTVRFSPTAWTYAAPSGFNRLP